jgi:hypothetical protein
MFNIEFLVNLMNSLHTNIHIPDLNPSFVVTIKAYRFRQPQCFCLYVTFENNIFKQAAKFLPWVYYHPKFQHSTLLSGSQCCSNLTDSRNGHIGTQNMRKHHEWEILTGIMFKYYDYRPTVIYNNDDRNWFRVVTDSLSYLTECRRQTEQNF